MEAPIIAGSPTTARSQDLVIGVPDSRHGRPIFEAVAGRAST